MDAVRGDEELAEQAREQKAEARRNLETAVRRAYQHILYLGRGRVDDHSPGRPVHHVRAGEPKCPGWDSRVEGAGGAGQGVRCQRARRKGTPAQPERRRLRTAPLTRSGTCSGARQPRMPLLPGGDSDLQRAIFQALQAADLRLVGPDGLDRVVNRPRVTSAWDSPVCAWPSPGAAPRPASGSARGEGGLFGGGGGPDGSGVHGAGSGSGSGSGSEESGGRPGGADSRAREQELAFTLMCSLTQNQDQTRKRATAAAQPCQRHRRGQGKLRAVDEVRIILDSSVADGLAEDTRTAGATPTIKEV